jgi:murein DD-endopeptidase MepM/ murein hydrolase activator NlpD
MDGRVAAIGRDRNLGNFVKIDHGNGVETLYGHNRVNLVAVNDIVRRGQIIATVGSTGRSTGPHVHFEVRINDQAVNPAPWLNDTEEISAEIIAYNEKFLLSAPKR